VNGTLVWDDGKATGAKPGRVLLSEAAIKGDDPKLKSAPGGMSY